jgi:hypothetical protein
MVIRAACQDLFESDFVRLAGEVRSDRRVGEDPGFWRAGAGKAHDELVFAELDVSVDRASGSQARVAKKQDRRGNVLAAADGQHCAAREEISVAAPEDLDDKITGETVLYADGDAVRPSMLPGQILVDLVTAQTRGGGQRAIRVTPRCRQRGRGAAVVVG